MIFRIDIVCVTNLKSIYRRAKDIFLYVLVYQIYHSHIFGVWYFFEIEKQIKRYVLNLSIQRRFLIPIVHHPTQTRSPRFQTDNHI